MGPRIEKLSRLHVLDSFTCGQPDLDRFLHRHALQAQQSDASQTWLALENDDVVGFYTLVVGQVLHADAPPRIVKGMPRHPVPLMILARLAVHTKAKGRRLGSGLLIDALRRTLQAADIGGIRAMASHAKDEQVAAFYRYFGFEPSPTDPLHLFRIMKDIRAAAERAKRGERDWKKEFPLGHDP